MWMSFKYRFILSFVTLEAIFISLIVFFNFSSLDKLSDELINEKIEAGSTLFVELVKTPLSIYDLGTLDNAVGSLAKIRNIAQVRVFDNNGLLLSSYDDGVFDEWQDEHHHPERFFTSKARDYGFKSLPVVVEGMRMGHVDILFEMTESLEVIRQNRERTFMLIFVEIVLSSLLSFLIGHRLAKELQELTEVAQRFDEGHTVHFPELGNSHEVRVLSDALRHMYEQVRERDRYLQERIDEAIEENSRQQSVLIKQSRFAAMGEMIVMIAHQWRQPLTALGLIIQNLELSSMMGEVSNKEIREMSEESMRHIDFMSRTINDFMEFNKTGKSKEGFNIAATVQGSISIIQATLNSGSIDLQTRGLDNAELEAYGAPSEFKQVVVNLLGNAKDAVIAANKGEGAVRWIRLSLSEEPGAAVLCVEDNGGGIPDGIMERIFEPYFTTKEEVQGTGIGLYMSKMIIEQSMNGSISVENREAGACFTVRLPKYEG